MMKNSTKILYGKSNVTAVDVLNKMKQTFEANPTQEEEQFLLKLSDILNRIAPNHK